MTVYTSVASETIRRAQADIDQLTRPIHIAVGRRIATHPCLLDQLRRAAEPGSAHRGPERRTVPRSRPPIRLDPVDAHAAILVDLAGWHARLRLPSPPRDADWQKAVLRMLPGALADLAPAVADWCGTDILEWWRMAAVHSGWRPHELRRIR